MAKIDNIYNAVDDFGLITSAEAAPLGMSNAEMVQQAAKGKLVRVERGVYRIPIWPFQKEAPYAIAIKAAGTEAFLYGESVIALLELAPTNPAKMWIAVPRRTRKNLGGGVTFVHVKNSDSVLINGIPCQPVAQAIVSAIPSIGHARAKQAALEAFEQGFINESEKAEIEKRCNVS